MPIAADRQRPRRALAPAPPCISTRPPARPRARLVRRCSGTCAMPASPHAPTGSRPLTPPRRPWQVGRWPSKPTIKPISDLCQTNNSGFGISLNLGLAIFADAGLGMAAWDRCQQMGFGSGASQMVSWWKRLMRVLWRNDSEGRTDGASVVRISPAAAPLEALMPLALKPRQPLEQAPEAEPVPQARRASPQNFLFAARLHAVAKLNAPLGRAQRPAALVNRPGKTRRGSSSRAVRPRQTRAAKSRVAG